MRKNQDNYEGRRFFNTVLGGVAGMTAGPLALGYGYTGWHQYKNRKKGKASKYEVSDYWKKNPEAYKFYKYKKAKGDMKSVDRLMEKIKKPGGGGGGTKINYFKSEARLQKIVKDALRKGPGRGEPIFKRIQRMDFLTDLSRRVAKAGFKADETRFFQKKAFFMKKHLVNAMILGTALGYGIGHISTRKKRR